MLIVWEKLRKNKQEPYYFLPLFNDKNPVVWWYSLSPQGPLEEVYNGLNYLINFLTFICLKSPFKSYQTECDLLSSHTLATNPFVICAHNTKSHHMPSYTVILTGLLSY